MLDTNDGWWFSEIGYRHVGHGGADSGENDGADNGFWVIDVVDGLRCVWGVVGVVAIALTATTNRFASPTAAGLLRLL